MLSASLKGNKDITNKIANRPKINKSNLLNEYFLKLKKILLLSLLIIIINNIKLAAIKKKIKYLILASIKKK